MSFAAPRTLLTMAALWSGGKLAQVNDQAGFRTITLVQDGVWTRLLLCTASTAGTETSPHELLKLVTDALNNGTAATRWSVTLDPSGVVKFRYTGTGTGTVGFVGTDLRNALGFTANISVTSSTTQLATNAPSHAIIAPSVTEDSDWTPETADQSASLLQGGQVIAWADEHQSLTRQFSMRFFPRDEATRTALGRKNTPYWPPDAAGLTRIKTPSASTTGIAGWSVHEFLSTCLGKRIAFTLGSLQEILAGTTVLYDTGYALPELLASASNRARPMLANYRSQIDVPAFGLTHFNTESKT